jgi:leucyl-tRNA synthetase
MVLAPENPLVAKLTTSDKKADVEAYVARTRRFTEIERLSTEKEKDGVFIGAYATNRLNGEKVPIWIADYVLQSYGTGAVMGVPAHDERDFAFALKYGIPIIPVIEPTDGIAKSFAFPDTMLEGFEEDLKKSGFEYSPAKIGGWYVTLHSEVQIEKYIKLMKAYLKPDNWNDIIGSPWLFFFSGKDNKIETIALDSIVSEREILKRCKKIEPNVRNCRTVVEMLNNCEFYRDRLFHTEYGAMIHSGQFTANTDGINAVTAYLEQKGWGKGTISYRMRDWLISRQRYWGAPIPMIYCDKCGIVPVLEKDLPVRLPEDADFSHKGESPLKYNEKWVNTKCPKCGDPGKRETDTIDGFMCSSWYFLRYCSPDHSQAAFDPEKIKYWMPVDIYTGGAEHAVMHLLYARFFTKALRDMGLINFGEPFAKLFNQGIIIAEHEKMSKSKGNVVNPDEYVNELGADTVRAYMMFIGPWEQGGEWFDTGISGVSRWLNRVWNLALEDYQPQSEDENARRELERTVHQTIKKVTGDMDRLRFNTMIAALMELTNYLSRLKETSPVSSANWRSSIENLLLLLAPTAPHMTEELWQRLGHKQSIHNEHWPKWDEALAKEEEITLVVQVNGKLRDRIIVPASTTEVDAKQIAADSTKVKPYLEGKEAVKMIYVPGKLVNIVVR